MSEGSEGQKNRDLAAESWLRLSDGLIAGIHHALNNRMAALGAAGQVLETYLPDGHPLSGAITGELHRLETTAGLLRLLNNGDGREEPIQLDTTIGEVQQLLQLHHGLRDFRLEVSLAPALYPLYTQPPLLLRAILLMLAVAAQRLDGSGELRLEAAGDEAVVRISVLLPENGGDGHGPGLDGIQPEGLAALAQALKGEFEYLQENGGARLVLALPTLPEVRRRESAAAAG